MNKVVILTDNPKRDLLGNLLLSLELLGNKAVGIGDHSTEDFYKNAEEALMILVDADDRLATLENYFSTITPLND